MRAASTLVSMLVIRNRYDNRKMPLVIGSAELADDEFLAAFHACTLDPTLFRHGDHLRLAWLYVHRGPLEEAVLRVRTEIKAFAASHGASQKFHETMTEAWVRLIATHSESSFENFIKENESRLNGALLHRFWSPEVLASDEARVAWVPPDRHPLPQAG